jgi:hypothetical protein
MKLLFGFLLALCLGLFAYMQWGGQLSGMPKNGQLMPDLNADKIKLLTMPAAKQIAASAVQQIPQAVAASAPAAAETIAASAPLPASAPLAIAASAPVVAVVPVHASAPVAAPAPAPVHTPPVMKTAANSCMEWGEFSGTDLKLATQVLANMNLGNRLSQRIVEYDTGYWVYISPLKGKPAVKKKIEQLKAIGVEDYFVVQMPGHNVNAISLGVFKTREAAQNHLSHLKEKGVRTAKVGERKSRLKFTVFAIKQVDQATAANLTKLQKEFANSELNTVACK